MVSPATRSWNGTAPDARSCHAIGCSRRRADRDLHRVAGIRQVLQGVAKARPADVEGGTRRGIARRDVVEHENVGGTGLIAVVVLLRACIDHGCVDQAHAALDLRDQAAKVGRNQLTAVGLGRRDERWRAGQI
ncbi:bll0387 [Bradyrhizobium diazoefficiens USDA 110]|uniref:Bll0387 protein n=1 Tax=Bradyrhizobium diazoefficiens (strain JCM 10833 / BCRC 13528 / IAM 13628 / NBRC 14792 / USDA 110) TaxID=224911 RepID=Q89XC7_BRADU|nr:hypothetical protein CO678_15555 [Bradyrhizobium diazoefficiens]QBP19345.1 hypothetical protein Bdiaspc4_01610 [Bradyrhizobium diazoefficiens]BAC45652.1 bll0387 [Bradyrhizobium diazoefficiens USDA 110]